VSAKPSESQFDQAEAEALLQQRYAEALADPALQEHSEKLQSAWGNKVRGFASGLPLPPRNPTVEN
jgi:hypothetical protein